MPHLHTLTALLLALACASPASAMFICTDSWGRTYKLPHAVGDGAANFNCHPEGAAPPRAPPANAWRQSNSAAAALGLPVAEPQARSGGMALVVSAESSRVRPQRRASLQANDTGDLLYARSVESPTEALPNLSGKKPSEPMNQMIAGVARQYGHDVNLLKAIVFVESRFNPNALSPKGAIGLMQVMPATGSRVGINQPKKNLYDPEMNLHAGARYLRILLNMFSDRPELAVAAYNAGEGAVLRHNRGIPPYPETQSYVRQVMAQYKHYQSL
jgi:soluble lytic murein transglycosylase-like protein